MQLFQTIYLAAMALFAGYLGISIALFGIPRAYSALYYCWDERRKGWGMSFFLVNIALVFAIAMVGLELSKDQNLQALAFLFPAALAFVAAAPRFLEPFEGRIHRIAAIACAIAAILWCLLVAHTWWLIPASIALMLIVALATRTLRSSLTFWAEMAAFACTFGSMALMLFGA